MTANCVRKVLSILCAVMVVLQMLPVQLVYGQDAIQVSGGLDQQDARVQELVAEERGTVPRGEEAVFSPEEVAVSRNVYGQSGEDSVVSAQAYALAQEIKSRYSVAAQVYEPKSASKTVAGQVYEPISTGKTVSGQVYGKRPESRSIVRELVDKRTRNSKSYLNDDDTITVTSATYALHYNKGNGWQDIDTRIRGHKDEPEFTDIADGNDFTVKFDKRNKLSVSFEVYGSSVTYIPQAINKKVSGIVTGDTMIYSDAWPHTDMIYKVTSSGLKMELNLKNKQAPKSFRFELMTKDAEPIAREDGGIDFYNRAGNVTFSIPPMWVRDSSSSEHRYGRVQTEILRKGKLIVLVLSVNDEGLVYPLLVDPSTYTEVYGVGVNTIYIDVPNVDVSSVVSVYMKGEEYDVEGGNYNSQLAHTYLTKQEYGSFSTWGNVAPGNDGRQVAYLGVGYENYYSGDQVKTKFGSSGTIYGAAFQGYTYPYQSYPANLDWAYVSITYVNRQATIVSNTIPATMEQSQTYPVSVTMRNDGDEAWTEANLYRLGAVGESDPFASTRQFILGGQVVAPGQQYTFSFNMTAPTGYWNLGNQVSDWRMVRDGIGWFGQTLSKTVNVVDTRPPVGTGISPSTTIVTNGSGHDVYAYGINDSGSGVHSVKFPTWTEYNGQDELVWHEGVNLGGGTWKFTIPYSQHLNESGIYITHVYVYDYAGNYSYLGETRVNVLPGYRADTFIANTIPTAMALGTTYPVTITVRNDGYYSWREADSYRLGAVGDSDPFAAGRQYITGGQTISTGQQYTFSFNMTPTQIGTYVTDWAMVQDGETWFGPTLSKTVTVTDPIPPSVPSNPISTGRNGTNLGLSWGASSDNSGISGYEIYNNSTYVGFTTTPTFTVTGIVEGATYNFKVRAKDLSGNYSAYSGILTITINDTIPPTPPSNLQVTGKTGTTVSLSWSAATDNVGVSGYDIYMGSNLVGSTPGLTFMVNNLTPVTAYTFTVKAKDAAANVSAASNTISVTTADGVKPSTPSNVSVVSKTESSVSLSWSASTDNVGVTGYDIYSGSTLLLSVSTTNATVANLLPGIRYTLSVRAKDAEGNASDFSKAVTFTLAGQPEYFYDASGRLDYIKLPNNLIIDYQYDNNGNLLRVVYP